MNIRNQQYFLCLIVIIVSVNFLPTHILHVEAQTNSENHSNSEKIKELLTEADSYPNVEEAYDLYRKVLELDILNQHARNKIIEIANIYRYRMKEAEQQEDINKAKTYYEQYRDIIRYLLYHVLSNQLKHEGQRLTEAETEKTDTEEIIVILNNIIGILTEIKTIYEQYPRGDFGEQIKKLDFQIKTYKQKLDSYKP